MGADPTVNQAVQRRQQWVKPPLPPLRSLARMVSRRRNTVTFSTGCPFPCAQSLLPYSGLPERYLLRGSGSPSGGLARQAWSAIEVLAERRVGSGAYLSADTPTTASPPTTKPMCSPTSSQRPRENGSWR